MIDSNGNPVDKVLNKRLAQVTIKLKEVMHLVRKDQGPNTNPGFRTNRQDLAHARLDSTRSQSCTS